MVNFLGDSLMAGGAPHSREGLRAWAREQARAWVRLAESAGAQEWVPGTAWVQRVEQGPAWVRLAGQGPVGAREPGPAWLAAQAGQAELDA